MTSEVDIYSFSIFFLYLARLVLMISIFALWGFLIFLSLYNCVPQHILQAHFRRLFLRTHIRLLEFLFISESVLLLGFISVHFNIADQTLMHFGMLFWSSDPKLPACCGNFIIFVRITVVLVLVFSYLQYFVLYTKPFIINCDLSFIYLMSEILLNEFGLRHNIRLRSDCSSLYQVFCFQVIFIVDKSLKRSL